MKTGLGERIGDSPVAMYEKASGPRPVRDTKYYG